MRKLYKYLESRGYVYQKERFGCNYFYNVPAMSFDGVIITFGIHEIDACFMPGIKKFCEKNGYTLFRFSGFPGFQSFSVMKKEEKQELDFIIEYMKKSVDACEDAIHLRAQGFFTDETDAQFNDRLKGIMEFYGEEYLAAVSAVA